MESLNKFFSFFFISSKVNSLLFINLGINKYKTHVEAIMAKSIYKKQIRRYLGLGFFLSFIPGTEAFLARSQLFSVITRYESEIKNCNNDATITDDELLAGPFHIFIRTFKTILQANIDADFFQILQGLEKVNRLNPFLYLTQSLKFFVNIFVDFLNIGQPPGFLQAFFLYIILLPILFTFAVLSIATAVLYLPMELLLNSLYTLLVEPFIFAYEVLHQLITGWDLEFTYFPTKEFSNIEKILDAIPTEGISKNVINKNVYQTNELTLLETTAERINSYEKHRNSFFFKFYKETDLFQKNKQTITTTYNQYENLFNFFTIKKLPMDVKQTLIETCLKLD